MEYEELLEGIDWKKPLAAHCLTYFAAMGIYGINSEEVIAGLIFENEPHNILVCAIEYTYREETGEEEDYFDYNGEGYWLSDFMKLEEMK